jgi:hypothetical protein
MRAIKFLGHQEIEWLIRQDLYNPANERQRLMRPDFGHIIPVVGGICEALAGIQFSYSGARV